MLSPPVLHNAEEAKHKNRFFSGRGGMSRDENFLGDLSSMQRRILLSLAGAPAQEDQTSMSLLQSPVFGRGEF